MRSRRAYNRRQAVIPKLHPRLQPFLDKISADKEASEVMRTLTRQGVEEVDILTGLFCFCGGTEKELRSGLKYGRNFAGRLQQAAERLRRDVELVSQLRKESAQLGLELHAPEFDNCLRTATG